MDIKTARTFVEGHSKALTLYTDILGVQKVNDIDLGEFRWLTASTVGSDKIEFPLKPNVHPAAKAYQEAIYADATLITAADTKKMKLSARFPC